MGLIFAPLRGEEVLSPEEFQKLPEDERSRLKEQIEEFQGELQKISRQLPTWQREKREQVQQLDREVSQQVVQPLIDEVRNGYRELDEVMKHLDVVETDILENAQSFVAREGEDVQEALQLLSSSEGFEKPVLRRYTVNVLVDHGATEGAPVVYEANPTYPNLVGRVEHLSHMGALVTDFNLIKAGALAGALHRANGGYPPTTCCPIAIPISAACSRSPPTSRDRWTGPRRARFPTPG